MPPDGPAGTPASPYDLQFLRSRQSSKQPPFPYGRDLRATMSLGRMVSNPDGTMTPPGRELVDFFHDSGMPHKIYQGMQDQGFHKPAQYPHATNEYRAAFQKSFPTRLPPINTGSYSSGQSQAFYEPTSGEIYATPQVPSYALASWVASGTRPTMPSRITPRSRGGTRTCAIGTTAPRPT